MWRDVVELTRHGWLGTVALMLFVLLPVAALAIIRLGHRSAWISLLLALGLIGGWLLYYTTGWWETAGAGRVFTAGGMTVAAGWLILGWPLVGGPKTGSEAESGVGRL